MAVNIIMEKSTFTGRDSSGKEHYRAVLLADTTDELPAREWNGIVLEQGSSITSIGEGAEYMMNSAGAWVRQGGEGGSSLPDVTADDNGDVLTVVEGEWTKSAPQSPFKIVKASKSSNTITFVNETQNSIYEAVNNGQFVVIDIESPGGGRYVCYVSAITSSTVSFINVYRGSEATTFYCNFTVTKSSDSDHTTSNQPSSDDYSSGGPV